MRQVIPALFCVIAFSACAPAASRMPMGLAPHPDVSVVGGGVPLPVFEAPPGWVEVDPDSAPDDAAVASVTLSRPELDGMLLLEVIRSEGMTPLEQARRLRAQLVRVMPDALVSEAAESYDGPDEAGFVFQGARSAGPDEDLRKGKVLFRTIPGDPEHLAMCQGWWPESSHAFLISPLHQACETVALR